MMTYWPEQTGEIEIDRDARLFFEYIQLRDQLKHMPVEQLRNSERYHYFLRIEEHLKSLTGEQIVEMTSRFQLSERSPRGLIRLF